MRAGLAQLKRTRIMMTLTMLGPMKAEMTMSSGKLGRAMVTSITLISA